MILKKQLFFIFALLLFSNFSKSQCVTIESILVDACGFPEIDNEMLRFKVGPNNLNVSNMTMTFGFGQPFPGIRNPDFSSASKVNQLNATIQSCGFLKEPIGGVLPANSTVLVIGSVNVNVNANPFTTLSDTIIVLFKNPTTSPNAYYINYAPPNTPPAPDAQTTTVSFGQGCMSTVTYLRSQLINQNGLPGAQDGATVNFSANGAPTYINNGCIAPFEPVSAAWTNPGVICSSDGILNLIPFITGTPGGVFSGQGVSSNAFNPSGISGTVTITYTVSQGGCENSVSHDITVIQQPTATWNAPEYLCIGDTINLESLITGTGNGTWSGNGVFGNLFITNGLPELVNITYTVGSGTCQASSTQTINVINLPPPIVVGTSNYCEGEEITALEVFNSGSASVIWYDDENLSTVISQSEIFTPPAESATYYVILTKNTCVSEATSYTINISEISANINTNTDNAVIPFELIATSESQNAESCVWFLNDEPFDYQDGDIYLISEVGEYTLKLVCENAEGCEAIDQIQFNVIDNKVEINIPNVFTPNNDGINDFFNLDIKGIKTISGLIMNRWGKQVYAWDDLSSYWDGTVNGQKAIDGVYFYIIETIDINDQVEEHKGTVTLIR
jgi:gliding motility-associated-like protein